MKEEEGYQRPDYSDIENLSIYKAVRYNCVDCVCNQTSLIENCPDFGCSLWRFRFGINPTAADHQGRDVRKLRGGKAPRLS